MPPPVTRRRSNSAVSKTSSAKPLTQQKESAKQLSHKSFFLTKDDSDPPSSKTKSSSLSATPTLKYQQIDIEQHDLHLLLGRLPELIIDEQDQLKLADDVLNDKFGTNKFILRKLLVYLTCPSAQLKLLEGLVKWEFCAEEILSKISNCLTRDGFSASTDCKTLNRIILDALSLPHIQKNAQVLLDLLQFMAKPRLGPLKQAEYTDQEKFIKALLVGRFNHSQNLLVAVAKSLYLVSDFRWQAAVKRAFKYIYARLEAVHLRAVLVSIYQHKFIIVHPLVASAQPGHLTLQETAGVIYLCGINSTELFKPRRIPLETICRALAMDPPSSKLAALSASFISELQAKITISNKLLEFNFASIDVSVLNENEKLMDLILAHIDDLLSDSVTEKAWAYNFIENMFKSLFNSDYAQLSQLVSYNQLLEKIFNYSTGELVNPANINLRDSALIAVLSQIAAQPTNIIDQIFADLSKKFAKSGTAFAKGVVQRLQSLLNKDLGPMAPTLTAQIKKCFLLLAKIVPESSLSQSYLTLPNHHPISSKLAEEFSSIEGIPLDTPSAQIAIKLSELKGVELSRVITDFNASLATGVIPRGYEKLDLVLFSFMDQGRQKQLLYQIQFAAGNNFSLQRLELRAEAETSNLLTALDVPSETELLQKLIKPSKNASSEYLINLFELEQYYPQALISVLDAKSIPFNLIRKGRLSNQWGILFAEHVFQIDPGEVFCYQGIYYQLSQMLNTHNGSANYMLKSLDLTEHVVRKHNLKHLLADGAYYYSLDSKTPVTDSTGIEIQLADSLQLADSHRLRLNKNSKGEYSSADPATRLESWADYQIVYHEKTDHLFVIHDQRLICIANNRRLVNNLFPSGYFKQNRSGDCYLLVTLNQIFLDPYTAARILNSWRAVGNKSGQYSYTHSLAPKYSQELFLALKSYLSLHRIEYIQVAIRNDMSGIEFIIDSARFAKPDPHHLTGDLGFKFLEAIYSLLVSATRFNNLPVEDRKLHKHGNKTTLKFVEGGIGKTLMSIFEPGIANEADLAADSFFRAKSAWVIKQLPKNFNLPNSIITTASQMMKINPKLLANSDKLIAELVAKLTTEQINQIRKNILAYCSQNSPQTAYLSPQSAFNLALLQGSSLMGEHTYTLKFEWGLAPTDLNKTLTGISILNPHDSSKKITFELAKTEHLLLFFALRLESTASLVINPKLVSVV